MLHAGCSVLASSTPCCAPPPVGRAGVRVGCRVAGPAVSAAGLQPAVPAACAWGRAVAGRAVWAAARGGAVSGAFETLLLQPQSPDAHKK